IMGNIYMACIMRSSKYIIPVVTLSTSCYPSEPIKTPLCNTFQAIDPMGNLYAAEAWRQDYCPDTIIGYWEARSFGFWYTLPIDYSSTVYGVGETLSYSIRGELYMSSYYAELNFFIDLSFYDTPYNNYYTFEGVWEKQENRYMITLSGNQGVVQMECTHEEESLNCDLQNSFMGSGMDAAFVRAD
ncbi:MAG: hypothetical protein VX278_06265, partial [Myxococcota bacterium]|nr:hypothetical protein [Myxococcota bacterium]